MLPNLGMQTPSISRSPTPSVLSKNQMRVNPGGFPGLAQLRKAAGVPTPESLLQALQLVGLKNLAKPLYGDY